MIITAFNPEVNDLEKSYISAYVAAGVNQITVKNNQNMTNGRRALLGRMGQERSELVTLGTKSGTTILNLGGVTAFPHNADDPVYLLNWDQIRFYRADSIDGVYTLLATTDIDVDNADKVTRYDDVNSLATHYYKTTYYNSVTLEETDYSDPISAGGYGRKTAGKIIDAHIRRVRDPGYTVLGVDEYLDIMQEVNDDLLMQSHKPYLFMRKTVTLSTVAGQNYIAFPTDFWKFDYVEYAPTSGGYTDSRQITPLTLELWNDKYKGNMFPDSDSLLDVAVDEVNKRLMIAPAPKTSVAGVFTLSYYTQLPEIKDLGSPIYTPTTLIYRYKLLAEFYSAKSETDNQWARLAEKYEAKYGNEMVKMQRANRVDVGTVRSMAPRRVVDPHWRRRYHL